MIYDDYIQASDEYRRKYGERTVVLMEVGSFFELYAIQNEHETSGADIGVVCDLCNLQLSRKNKNVVENNRSNPLMAGFPTFALSKHTQILLSNNYTVVLIKQVTCPPNPKREVTEILSPGLQICPSGMEGSWLLVSYWDVSVSSFGKRCLNVGLCGMDVSTGQTWVYEVADDALSLDELSRCFSMYQPREAVFISSPKITGDDKERILESVGRPSAGVHKLWESIHDGEQYTRVNYQNIVLQNSYAHINFGILSPLEILDLEKYDNVRTAFTFMIQFGYEHNNNIIRHLAKPEHISHDKRCNLEHTSAVQLQVISSNQSNNNERPLLSILNRCATAFGARAFKSRLLQPIFDTKELERRYDSIDGMIKNVDCTAVHRELRCVLDIERMARRMILGTFSPTDWPGFHTSMQGIQAAVALCGERESDLRDKVSGIMCMYENTIDLNECSKYLIGDIKGNIFQENVYEDVDGIYKRHQDALESLESLATTLNEKASFCKVDYNDRDGHFIQVTKKRWESIYSSLPDVIVIKYGTTILKRDFHSRTLNTSSTVVKVSHPWIATRSDDISKASVVLSSLVTKRYKEFLENFAMACKDKLQEVVWHCARLDVDITCARNAVNFNYCRPSISRAEAEESSVRSEALRHPILERIHDRTVYVPNDVSLGSSGRPKGMLLFGVNSSGKSSLMKAVGLNIIMAQAGMYVAAKEFAYNPYRHIFTRIAGNDDIYRGWSTFTVEMMELRNIINRANKYSLVLGDELCSGTESLSASAIVAAGIETLVKQEAMFVFATHLHDLSKMPRIAEKKDTIFLCHMHVECKDGKIVYDRRLREGVGSGVYGLEVCRGLDMPADFLRIAHEIRCDIQGESSHIVEPKQSRYNSAVYVDKCGICNKKAQETHHIAHQHTADTHGYIDHYHKNRSFNLLPICEQCHDAIHAGDIIVKGYISTTDGVQLDVDIPKHVSGLVKRDDERGWQVRTSPRGRWKSVSKTIALEFIKERGFEDNNR